MKHLIHDPVDSVYIVFGRISLFAEDWLMIRISLPDPAVRQLECLFQTTSDVVLRHRIQIVLMAHRGRKHSEIAADTDHPAVGPALAQRLPDRWSRPTPAPQGQGSQTQADRRFGPDPPSMGDRRAGSNRDLIGPTGPTPNWPTTCTRPRASGFGKSAMQVFGAKHGIRPYRPTYRFSAATRPSRPKPGRNWPTSKKGGSGRPRPLSQDEARFPMVPTLTATLGVKGHRPVVGTWDCKHLPVRVCRRQPGQRRRPRDLLDSPKGAKAKTGKSKTRRLQEAFAAHLRHVGRQYPAAANPRVVILIDNAPWHAGESMRAALAENPHLELKRLPSYSPQLNPIERFWKLLRRRATHNRLFDALADLRKSIRSSLSYFQTMHSGSKRCWITAQKTDAINRIVNEAAQSLQRSSACWSTVWTSFSCLSGG